MEGARKHHERSADSRRFLLPICYLGFVSLGLPDTLIGVAWPSVRDTFGLSQSQVSWIFFGSGCSYFLSSFFAGRLLTVFNVGVLLGISSGFVALSGFNYSIANNWPWFAAGALLHGLGSGAIDSGLNHYVASHFSARQMNWLHACYSLGAMLGPAVMIACLARPGGWRTGYLVVAVTLCVLAVLFLLTRSLWIDPPAISKIEEGQVGSALTESVHEPPNFPHPDAPTPKAVELAAVPASTWTTLRNRTVQLHIVLFFIYTGIEVAVGQWSFTVLTESRSIGAKIDGTLVTIYWGSILAGRVVFGFVVDRMGIDQLVRLSLVTAVIGVGLFAWNPTLLSAPIGLALSGLGLAVIFPCLMTRTPQRLGKELAAHAIGFQVGAAMIGAAVLPSLCGFIAQGVGLRFVPATLFVMAIALFALHEFLLFAIRERSA